MEAASGKLPKDPFAWYTLGLAYKDSAEPEKAIEVFQHVEKIVSDEPDAYHFEGFLLSQLQRYDEAIVAFKKSLAIAPDHAAQFGLEPIPSSWVRDYFFYADGFEKDLDFDAAYAFSVEPLPRHGLIAYPYPEGKGCPVDAGHLGYEFEYNTRSRSDRMPGNLRYEYPAPK